MFKLNQIAKTPSSKRGKRVGRGRGSKLGKTSGRGQKGMGARSGVKWRWGYEGGQMPLHMKLPRRGFSRARFAKPLDVVNLGMIEEHFQDGDEVSFETLKQRGLIRGKGYGLKILGEGQLTKKVVIVTNAMSESAKQKLEEAKIDVKMA